MCPHKTGNYVGDSQLLHCDNCDNYIYKEKMPKLNKQEIEREVEYKDKVRKKPKPKPKK